jgi:hypothetical protein
MRLPQNIRNNVYRLNVSYALRYVLKENIAYSTFLYVCLLLLSPVKTSIGIKYFLFPLIQRIHYYTYSTLLREK